MLYRRYGSECTKAILVNGVCSRVAAIAFVNAKKKAQAAMVGLSVYTLKSVETRSVKPPGFNP